MRLTDLSHRNIENCLNEVRLLASLDSPYIIGYKESIYDESESALFIIMEYADDGDLRSKLIERRKHGALFPEAEVWRAAGHLLSALRDLHAMAVVHRDLKPGNVFLSAGVYKIGDLNVSKVLHEPMAVTQTGTPSYASPEIWLNQPYDRAVDVWSLGCVLFEMCALKAPFNVASKESLAEGMFKGLT